MWAGGADVFLISFINLSSLPGAELRAKRVSDWEQLPNGVRVSSLL